LLFSEIVRKKFCFQMIKIILLVLEHFLILMRVQTKVKQHHNDTQHKNKIVTFSITNKM